LHTKKLSNREQGSAIFGMWAESTQAQNDPPVGDFRSPLVLQKKFFLIFVFWKND
jgi:hypothetical protein